MAWKQFSISSKDYNLKSTAISFSCVNQLNLDNQQFFVSSPELVLN